MSLTVANTILSQLGGSKFRVMTGAYNFVGSENDLSFRIPGQGFAKDSINVVRIRLDPSDTYTMIFSRLRGTKSTIVKEVSDVYNDSLTRIFESVTGLRTRLF